MKISDEELSKMSQAELRQLKARITALIVTDQTDLSDAWLYEALKQHLSSMGVKAPFWPGFQKSAAYSLYRERYRIVVDFVSENSTVRTQVQRRRAYLILMKMLTRKMTAIGIPLTMRNICTHLKNVPEYFNQQFPGYVESGLLDIVLKQRA